MSTGSAHQVEIVGASMADIEALLDIDEAIAKGGVELGENVRLDVQEISKSSGFDLVALVVTGVITVAANVTTAMLVEYLKERLSRTKPKRAVTVTVDGQKITIEP